MSESVERVSRLTPTDGRTDGLTKKSPPSFGNLLVRYAQEDSLDSVASIGSLVNGPDWLESIRGARRPLTAEPDCSPINRYAWWLVLERDGRVCAWCPETERLTLDHLVPRNGGGSNYTENLRPLCGRCNSVKGHRRMDSVDTVNLGCSLSCLYCDPGPETPFLVAFCSSCRVEGPVPDWSWIV